MRKIVLYLSLILVFTLPWENMVVFPGIGTIGKIIGLFVAVSWVIMAVYTGKFRKITIEHALIYLFFLWNGFSLLWSEDPDHTLTVLLTSLQLAGLVLIIWDLYTTSTHLHSALQAYILGGYISILGLLMNYFVGEAVLTDRFTASGFNPNTIGRILAFGLPLAWYLAFYKQTGTIKKFLQIINFLYIPLAVACILLTASRGSLVATLPAFLYVIFSLNRIKPSVRILTFVALAATLLSVQSFIPKESYQRLGTTYHSIYEGDIGGRLNIWRESLIILTENPFLGVGSGAYEKIAETGKVTHNSFLAIATELGMIGAFIFSIILVIIFYRAYCQPKSISRMWLTVLFIWIIGALAQNMEDLKITWLFLSLVTVSAATVFQKKNSGESNAYEVSFNYAASE